MCAECNMMFPDDEGRQECELECTLAWYCNAHLPPPATFGAEGSTEGRCPRCETRACSKCPDGKCQRCLSEGCWGCSVNIYQGFATPRICEECYDSHESVLAEIKSRI